MIAIHGVLPMLWNMGGESRNSPRYKTVATENVPVLEQYLRARAIEG
jgi:hypothetical protein